MSEITSEINSEITSETEPTKAVTEAVTNTLKRVYTMSDLKKEQLTKARARALELRNALNAIKPPKVKPVKVKKPSKMEIEISEIKAAAPVTEPTPVTEPEVSTEPVSPPVAHRAPVTLEPKLVKKDPIKKQRKTPSLLVSAPIPPPTKEPTVQPLVPPPIGFRRNDFGFYVL